MTTPESLRDVRRFYEERVGPSPDEVPVESTELADLRLLLHDTRDVGVPCTAVTLGMSGRRMSLPPEATDHPARAELIAYLPAADEEHTAWLAWLARLPFIDDTWFGHGHTIYSPTPLFPDSLLQHFLLLPSLVKGHRDMDVTVEGDAVGLWWVVPITDDERNFKLARGVDDLLEVFELKRLPLVIDPTRKSLV